MNLSDARSEVDPEMLRICISFSINYAVRMTSKGFLSPWIPRNLNIYKSGLSGMEKPVETIQVTVCMVSAGFFDTMQSAL